MSQICTERDLLMLYKRETGEEPYEFNISATRSRGRWILDCDDETAIEIFGRKGTVNIPSPDFLNWMQNKLIELLS